MMSAPGFWDDNEKAAKISEEHASAAKKINLFGSLESRVSDIDELIAFAAEEGDQGSVSEVKKEIDELSLMLGDLEMELLLSGKHDKDNAFLTIHAGTGGTEAEAEYDVLKDEGLLKIEGTDFGKKDLSVKADREDITDNENFGPGDGFVDINGGKLYVLKPGGNKDDFTSNSYEIIDLKSLY